MARSILLDPTTWDFVVTRDGDIATCTDPYRLAQDAACQCKLFLGELWFDTTQGVPYAQVLGRPPVVAYIKAQLVAAAMLVPGVVAARVFITSIKGRVVKGQVQVTDQAGKITAAGF
jgi:hypothetical protein